MIRAFRFVAFVAVACLPTHAVRAQSLEVIELEHRTAEDVIPVIRPLLDANGALSGQGYTLFVRTSAANLAQVRAAIEQIDRKPRQLMISVRSSTEADMQRERASASGTIRSDSGAVSVNERIRTRSGATVRGTKSHDHARGGGVSSVKVLEGASALISSGASVPVITTVAGGAGRRSWGATTSHYRELTDGVLVTPRLTSDGVVLDIEQRTERLRDGTIDHQQLSTQVSARLGEWVQLGGVEQSSTRTQSGLLSRQYATQNDTRSLWVKVEEE